MLLPVDDFALIVAVTAVTTVIDCYNFSVAVAVVVVVVVVAFK